MISFFVPCPDDVPNPVTQGSKTMGRTKDGRPFMREAAGMKHRKWRRAVTEVAGGCIDGRIDGPVHVCLEFRLHCTERQLLCRYDLDKLARAVLDSLTMAGAWNDDGQVKYLQVSKDTTTRCQRGVEIEISRAPE